MNFFVCILIIALASVASANPSCSFTQGSSGLELSASIMYDSAEANVNDAVYNFPISVVNWDDGHYDFTIGLTYSLVHNEGRSAEVDTVITSYCYVSGDISNGVFSMSAEETDLRAKRDAVTTDDAIIQGSACIGIDCSNGESFGFDTLRLKENNLRIHFDDTSTSASFPNVDWEITANDSSNGGQNRFSITDRSTGKVPFTVESGAPSHSLYVEDSGEIGVGTDAPVVEVHVKSGDTPTLRLEQDGSSGFTAQTWDVAGNESNFFVRDTTFSSKLVLRIAGDQADNSIYVVGGGTQINNARFRGTGATTIPVNTFDATSFSVPLELGSGTGFTGHSTLGVVDNDSFSIKVNNDLERVYTFMSNEKAFVLANRWKIHTGDGVNHPERDLIFSTSRGQTGAADLGQWRERFRVCASTRAAARFTSNGADDCTP